MINSTRYSLNAEVQRQSTLAQQLARAQSDISNKTRLQAASDDVLASAQVSDIARLQAAGTVYKSNLAGAATLASQADTVLAGVATSVDQARALMVQGNNGTLTADDRASLITQLRGIAQDIQTASVQKDQRGQAIFPTGDPLKIPISADVTIAATSSVTKVFGSVQTDSGPMDMATIINNAADALALTDNDARNTASQTALAQIGDAVSHVANERADLGVRAARIDAVSDQLTTLSTTQAEQASNLQDTDIGETIARVSALTLSLNAAQAVFAKVNKSTLFDLIG